MDEHGRSGISRTLPRAREARRNLPVPFASFVGREQEISAVAALMSKYRLVTLVGAPGVGKTSLAIRLASSLASQYAEGAWLVELAPLFEPTLVAATTAQSLDVNEEGRPPLDALRQDLRDREMLVLLDNCEHLLGAAASMVESLLVACPHLHLLVTSRQPFGLIGEIAWQVPPMSVPERDGVSLDLLLGSEAGQLFVERARSARSSFDPAESDVSAMAEICARVDGIPLAIELAAARVAHLSPRQIASRLDDRFRLLAANSPVTLERHRTLRALVDWSHELLSDAERIVLRRLGVFAGSLSLEAAEAVCGESGLDVLDQLAQLVNKSLVQLDEQHRSVRYRLQDSIRQYALEKLEESGETELLRRRHAEYYATMADEAENRLYSGEQEQVLAQLAREHDDIRLALGWSSESGDPEVGMRLAGALWRFWQVRGHLREARAWLERLLGADAAQQSIGRARALNAIGFLTFLQGDYEAARPLLEQGLAISRALGDQRGVIESSSNMGLLLRCLEESTEARRHLNEALEVSRAVGDRAREGRVLNKMARLEFYEGDLQAASQLHELSLSMGRLTGNTWHIALVLGDLADVRFAMGDDDSALELYAQSVRLWQGIGDERGVAQGLEGFAMLAARRGQHDQVVLEISAARAIRQRISEPSSPSRRATLDQLLDEARAALGDSRYEAAWREGSVSTAEQLISRVLANEALDEATPPEARETAVDATVAPFVPGPEKLTTREIEIAAYIGQGLSNREIAETLVVSQRTVEWHVANLTGKLGFRSRAQIAAWAVGEGLGQQQ
jgi:non-specific serine/threonine protein kinase